MEQLALELNLLLERADTIFHPLFYSKHQQKALPYESASARTNTHFGCVRMGTSGAGTAAAAAHPGTNGPFTCCLQSLFGLV